MFSWSLPLLFAILASPCQAAYVFTIAWDAPVSGAPQAYSIEQVENSVGMPIATVPASSLTFSHQVDGGPGSRYEYAIRAIYNDGVSEPLYGIGIVPAPAGVTIQTSQDLKPQLRRRSTDRSNNVWIEVPKSAQVYINGVKQ